MNEGFAALFARDRNLLRDLFRVVGYERGSRFHDHGRRSIVDVQH